MPISHVENIDCMEAMKDFEDKFFDLAIVDPPYGIDIAKNGTLNTSSKTIHVYKPKQWDSQKPNTNYFTALFRVSKNQIVWGGNYFEQLWTRPCRGFIYWDKLNHTGNRADGELAWTSFDRVANSFKYMWDGNRYGFVGSIKGVGKPTERIHVTQKPIALYQWLLKNYAKPGDKILDTHLGSGSSRIAAYKMGFDFWGYEIDKDYFEAQEKRFKQAIAEPLFDNVKPEQQTIFK